MAATASPLHLSPERLQTGAVHRAEASTAAASLQLAYRPPYDVPGLLAFLLPRAVAGVESLDLAKASILRSVALHHAGQGHQGWLRASFQRPGQVEIELSASLRPAVGSLLPLLRRWLDLDADPQLIADALGEGACTGLRQGEDAVAVTRPGQSSGLSVSGLRLPGCLDRFELAVRAVLGQQITVAAARTVAGRFVARFGEPLAAAPPGLAHLFPSAARMAQATAEQIAELGIIRRRADSILELARRWPELRFARLQGGVDEALTELQSIGGIGPWTAHYMLMRGWSWPDAFPPGDVILRQVLSKAMGLDKPALLSPKACLAAAERFRPYRSYAVLQLWRQSK